MWTAHVMGSPDAGDPDRREAGERAVLLATKLHVPASGASSFTGRSARRTFGGTTPQAHVAECARGLGQDDITCAVGPRVRSEDQRFGWLSLDTSDNDPVWFWMYVVAALQKVSPGVGTRAFELLGMGADPLRVVLPNLLNELATSNASCAHP